MKLRLLAGLAIAALLSIGAVQAQVTLPQVTSVDPTDLIQVVPNGAPSAGNKYSTAAKINGVVGYANGGAATTGWTFTMANGQTNYFIQPAGTLATGVLTLPPNPGDGQRACFLSTQTQTAITWTANTGQSLSNAPTAGVAMVPQCMQFSATTATWYRSP